MTKEELHESCARCNRCGCCISVCASYQASKAEIYSPRGRNRLLRLILEGKLPLKDNRKHILRSAASCLQCAGCSTLCPAKTPTAAHMRAILEMLGKPLKRTLISVLKRRIATMTGKKSLSASKCNSEQWSDEKGSWLLRAKAIAMTANGKKAARPITNFGHDKADGGKVLFVPRYLHAGKDCEKTDFFIKLNKEKFLSPGLLARGYGVKDAKLLNKFFADKIRNINPDYIITLSQDDCEYFKKLLKKLKTVKVMRAEEFLERHYGNRY